MEEKVFAIRHKKSDGMLRINDDAIWCTVGDDIIFSIGRRDIRYCAISEKNTLVINRESEEAGGTQMRLLRIRSKHAGAILAALS